MERLSIIGSPKLFPVNPNPKTIPQITSSLTPKASNSQAHPLRSETRASIDATTPTMSEIMEASRAQKLDLRLQTVGPFFRITAKSLETGNELGKAEGIIRVWLGGTVLHLDSMRLLRETLGMEKSIFGIGLFIGAVAIRYGYDRGCRTAELMAVNDTDLYHQKVCFLQGLSVVHLLYCTCYISLCEFFNFVKKYISCSLYGERLWPICYLL